MKYKTFLMTLALFLLFYNLGILIISIATFKDTVNRGKEKSLGEHYFITAGLIKDFEAVKSREIDIDASIDSLVQPYSFLSGDKNVKLVFYKNKQIVYSNRLEITLPDSLLELPDSGNRIVSTQKSDGHHYVIVSGKLPEPYASYTMVYIYDMTEVINSWRQMKNLLFGTGFILSGFLAFGLFLLLSQIYKPLLQISKISQDIAAGAYDTRLPVNGHDELSKMAYSFNHMAEEIQRQMTELIATAEKKQQFIDNFAHELRTPLTAIYGYAEFMQKAAMTEDDRLSALCYIMSESRRLQTMSYQLLELANLKNDQVIWKELKIATLFQSVKQTLHSKIIDKEIHIEFRHEIDSIQGDACLLESLLVNLIDNAIKACARGGRIVVGAAMESGFKILNVQDNGKGMSTEVLQHITEPFYRAEKSRNRRDGGAGLGLSICREIAVQHGAEMKFMSRPGEGTTAKIYFTTST